MDGANTPPTPRSQLQIRLLQCQVLLAQRNQEIAELRRIPAISAERIPTPLADGPVPADLPVAQPVSPRLQGSPDDVVQDELNGLMQRPTRRRRSFISRILPSSQGRVLPVSGRGSDTKKKSKKNKKKSKQKKR